MIRRVAARYAYRGAVALLATGICAVALFLLVVAVPDLTRPVADGVTASPTATPSPTAKSPMGLSPIGVEMSDNADCAACHVTSNGVVGTRPIPVMGHPLWGWRDCTACHTTGSLVATAPGHSGLHKNDCLVCHKAPDAATASAAPARPHHVYVDKPCLSCHGKGGAPLPADMAGRDNCWVCHQGKEFADLFADASPSAPASSPAVSPTASPAATAAP